AFGMVPLEAMAHGLPVVLSNASYCGFAHHVTAGVDAIVLTDPHDDAELARRLQELADNPALAARLREHGLALAATFSWPRVAAQFAGLYAECVEALATEEVSPAPEKGSGSI